MKGLEPVVKELAVYPNEREWLEFKVNWCNPDEVGNTYQLCRTVQSC